MTLLSNHAGLAHLRLTDADLPTLARQGSVCQEQHRGKVRYKLRFRTPSGRQVVRNVPHHLVAQVRADLRNLQAHRHAVTVLRDVTDCVRQTRRNAKRQLQPVLDALGYHFHGTSIRRRRNKQLTVSFAVDNI